MIEAMACGTPVIAFRRGSVPEVMDHGVTGFVVDTVDEAARAVEQISLLSRAKIRATFEERFTASRMAREYVNVFSEQTSFGAVLQPPPLGSPMQSIAI